MKFFLIIKQEYKAGIFSYNKSFTCTIYAYEQVFQLRTVLKSIFLKVALSPNATLREGS